MLSQLAATATTTETATTLPPSLSPALSARVSTTLFRLLSAGHLAATPETLQLALQAHL